MEQLERTISYAQLVCNRVNFRNIMKKKTYNICQLAQVMKPHNNIERVSKFEVIFYRIPP